MPSGSTAACSSQYLNYFLLFAEEREWDIRHILSGTGILRQDLIQNNGLVTQSQLGKVISNSAQLLSIPGIGLEFGQQLPLTAHGILGTAAIGSPTVMDGLSLFQRFITLRTHIFRLSLKFEESHILLDFHISEKLLQSLGVSPEISHITKQFLIESAIAIAYKTSVLILGSKDAVSAICVNYPRPDHYQLYDNIFGDIAQFNTHHVAITIPLTVARKKSSSGTDLLQKMLTKECEALLHEQNRAISFLEEVTGIVRQSIRKIPAQEEIAKQLHLSTRTLRRRLKEEGTSYNQVVDSTKKSIALDLVENSTLSVSLVAESLGYFETTNFNRAFKRWTGMSPTEYRNND